MKDAEAFCGILEIFCVRMGVECAAAVDDGAMWIDGIGKLFLRLAWSGHFVGGVEVAEGWRREAALVVGQGWNVETGEAVLEKADGVSHEIE